MKAAVVPPKKVGLTGGIGSGKSTVAQMLATCGAALVDADAISRKVTQPGGAALQPIANALGAHLFSSSGELDRVALRELVFQDATARRTLESIIHPLVAEGIQAEILASTAKIIVLDIPLLAESTHWRHSLDSVVVVDCSAQTQSLRVKARNGWPDATVSAVLQAQSPRVLRLGAADHVVFNDGITFDELAQQVESLARCLGL